MTERWSTTLIRASLAILAIVAVLFVLLLCLGFSPGQMVRMFAHPITGGSPPAPDDAVKPADKPADATQQPAPPAPEGKAAAKAEPARRSFGALNYSVVGAYLVLMLAMGIVMSRKARSTRGFFIGEGKLNYVMVGVSLLGTYLSALTVTGLPAASYGKLNWLFIVQLPFLILTAIIITRFVLPRYREAGVISVYEYLEQRIHVSARLIASLSFVLFSMARMGMLLYLPALAFSTATGAPLPVCIVVVGVIVTAYTVLGGIAAVIATDVVQVAIFVIGAFYTLGYVFARVGVEQFLEVSQAAGKFQWVEPSTDVTKIVTLWLILETIFQTVRIYGTQQDMTQRYMTTESTEKANRSVWISIVGYIPLGFIFYFIGTALFAYFTTHTGYAPPEKPDGIYPYFIVSCMPPGVAGFMIAAIFAASMSSIDSLMNSSSTVCVEDFFKRFSRKPVPDSVWLRKAKMLTVLWGVLAVVCGLMCTRIQYAQIVWGKLMAVGTNGVLGLMALAFLPFRVNKWAAICGFVFSWVCLFVAMRSGINYLLWPVICNPACFLFALALHPLFSSGDEPARA